MRGQRGATILAAARTGGDEIFERHDAWRRRPARSHAHRHVVQGRDQTVVGDGGQLPREARPADRDEAASPLPRRVHDQHRVPQERPGGEVVEVACEDRRGTAARRQEHHRRASQADQVGQHRRRREVLGLEVAPEARHPQQRRIARPHASDHALAPGVDPGRQAHLGRKHAPDHAVPQPRRLDHRLEDEALEGLAQLGPQQVSLGVASLAIVAPQQQDAHVAGRLQLAVYPLRFAWHPRSFARRGQSVALRVAGGAHAERHQQPEPDREAGRHRAYPKRPSM